MKINQSQLILLPPTPKLTFNSYASSLYCLVKANTSIGGPNSISEKTDISSAFTIQKAATL